MTEVKCLNKDQMLFILANRENMTAKEMAGEMRVEHHKVTLFCQSNGIEPKQDNKRSKKQNDSYHIPSLPFDYKINWRNIK